MIRIFFLNPVHAFCNGILVGAGECGKYKCAAVWTSLIYMHSGTLLVYFTHMRHIGKVQLRIHTLRVHIHCQGYNIHVTGTLSISKQCSLDSVGTCQNTHFCICHAAATVIVRMQGNNDIFTIFHMFAHIFNLARIHMRHCQLYGYWKVDDAFVIRSRFPHIQYGIANLKSIFRLCSGKALRAVFKLEIAFRFFSKLF